VFANFATIKAISSCNRCGGLRIPKQLQKEGA
jgi:hypothetical protein